MKLKNPFKKKVIIQGLMKNGTWVDLSPEKASLEELGEILALFKSFVMNSEYDMMNIRVGYSIIDGSKLIGIRGR